MKILGIALTLLFVVAIISRLGSDKDFPGIISSRFGALANIFKGDFGQ